MESPSQELYSDRADIFTARPSPPVYASSVEFHQEYLHPYNLMGYPKLEKSQEVSYFPSSPSPSVLSSMGDSPISPYPHPYNSSSPSPSVLNFDQFPPISASCGCGCGGGPMVPQGRYQNPQLPFSPEYAGSITFSMSDGRCGFSMAAALNKDFGGLKDRDTAMLVDCGTSISLRLEWPGCPPWTKQIKTRDWRKAPRPINRGKLAIEIAKATRKFISMMQNTPQTDRYWRVGNGANQIRIDDLVLVRLERVSKASWQPHFRLLTGRTPSFFT